MVNIVLMDDHQVVRLGIQSLLEMENDFTVVAETDQQSELLKILERQIPVHIVLMEINMPQVDGIPLIKILKNLYPNLCIVILTMMDQLTHVTQAFNAGAHAFLIKNISKEELIFAIKHVAQGGQYICAEISHKLCQQFVKTSKKLPIEAVTFQLNSREMEVLILTADGFTNQEIAEQLYTSKRTIEGYRQSLMEKTGARNSAALIKFAFQHGLLS